MWSMVVRMGISLPSGVSVVELKLCNYDFGKLAFFLALRNVCCCRKSVH